MIHSIKSDNWAHALLQEYHHICWGYKVKMPSASLAICDFESLWGLWDADIRTIKIAKRLIESHSWDVVINILKHEMAHQIVTFIYKTQDGHGRLYQKACDMIGVPDSFRTATGDVPRVLTEDIEEAAQSEEAKKLKERVDKLLSLAQSSNEHEASLAMQRANELIKRYNLQRIESCNSNLSDYTYRIINHKKKRIERFQCQIASILSEFFFVDNIIGSLYDARTFTTHKTVELIGSRENVIIAEHIYFFLFNQLNFLWKKYQKSAVNNTGRKSRNSFYSGVLHGFREKLTQQEKEIKKDFQKESSSSGNMTLSLAVIKNDAGLLKLRKQRHPRLHTIQQSKITVDEHSYFEGHKQGKNITIHKGVSECNGFRNKMLPSVR